MELDLLCDRFKSGEVSKADFINELKKLLIMPRFLCGHAMKNL